MNLLENALLDPSTFLQTQVRLKSQGFVWAMSWTPCPFRMKLCRKDPIFARIMPLRWWKLIRALFAQWLVTVVEVHGLVWLVAPIPLQAAATSFTLSVTKQYVWYLLWVKRRDGHWSVTFWGHNDQAYGCALRLMLTEMYSRCTVPLLFLC
jgi:hypothetical protein